MKGVVVAPKARIKIHKAKLIFQSVPHPHGVPTFEDEMPRRLRFSFAKLARRLGVYHCNAEAGVQPLLCFNKKLGDDGCSKNSVR
jgi:hypothetical protein